jgi:hypothetical protein
MNALIDAALFSPLPRCATASLLQKLDGVLPKSVAMAVRRDAVEVAVQQLDRAAERLSMSRTLDARQSPL